MALHGYGAGVGLERKFANSSGQRAFTNTSWQAAEAVCRFSLINTKFNTHRDSTLSIQHIFPAISLGQSAPIQLCLKEGACKREVIFSLSIPAPKILNFVKPVIIK